VIKQIITKCMHALYPFNFKKMVKNGKIRSYQRGVEILTFQRGINHDLPHLSEDRLLVRKAHGTDVLMGV
jgi:hypothetical protein